MPGANRFEPVAGPRLLASFHDGKPAGLVLSTGQVTGSVGYSGKPLDILVGIDLMVRHQRRLGPRAAQADHGHQGHGRRHRRFRRRAGRPHARRADLGRAGGAGEARWMPSRGYHLLDGDRRRGGHGGARGGAASRHPR